MLVHLFFMSFLKKRDNIMTYEHRGGKIEHFVGSVGVHLVVILNPIA